ncbi:MAG: matrixin family metalloprotease [Myxococcota bacterium]
MLLVLSNARIASAFRTAAELPKLSSPVPVRYERSTFDYWIVRSSFPRDIAEFNPQDVVVAAAQSWAEPVCSNVRPQLRGLGTDPAAPGDGVNSVEWVSNWEERGFDPTAAGYTDVQFSREEGSNWTIAEADIYLNANFRWSLDANPTPPARSVKAVLVHEFGHSFGLIHPCEIDDEPRCTASDDANVTMYPVYNPEQASLAADDVAGICFLYPVPDCTATGCPGGAICSEGACRAECAGTLCDPGEICSAGRCQQPNPCPGNSCVGRICNKDSQCGLFEHCSTAGRCAQGSRLEGQACAESTDCERGVCFQGSCRQRCGTIGDCHEKESCEPLDAELSACVPLGFALGEACSAPLDCAGRRCLLNAKPNPVCTQDCGAAYPECPLGWACGSADGTPVCVPVRPTGGCAFRPLTSTRSSPSSSQANGTREFGCLFLAVALGFARQRRRRAARVVTTEKPC